MAYRANPFLERTSERTTSDQEFVRLFSPKVLERLPDGAFSAGVHVFQSPPGAGKTTLLRAFTPTALRLFWRARRTQDISEAYQRLLTREVLHDQEGPQLLGVFLSCASGYADLPPGAPSEQGHLFRALLDCRVVLRSLRSLSALLGMGSEEQLDELTLEYDAAARDLKAIPLFSSARELMTWAEQRERAVYSELDIGFSSSGQPMPLHVRFEGILWLQAVRFTLNGRTVAPKRLLMIDDVQRLRKKQRRLLIDEATDLRPAFPIWLAQRSIALGDELLSQGVREGRDVQYYALDDLWASGRASHQFAIFAQNVLDRRMDRQTQIPAGAFSQFLRDQIESEEVHDGLTQGVEKFNDATTRLRSVPRYSAWLARAQELAREATVDALRELYAIRILIARDHAKRQMSFDLEPLSDDDLGDRDNSQVQGAAEIFLHEELRIPYYFGIERLCVLATSNIDELLTLAAALYEGLRAKQVLRRPELILGPLEQERLVRGAAKQKIDFIPKNHTEGTRARKMLDAIGEYCRERTFLSNAPYAPGVTGVRLSQRELLKLGSESQPLAGPFSVLRRVLAECVAENLIVAKASMASTSRESGTVFYLNRTLCAHYGLPLQMGGWQDVSVEDLFEWIEKGRVPDRRRRLEMSLD